MIFKLVPLLNGLIDLITIDCILVGVVGVILLILISTYMKLEGLYLKSRKAIRYVCSSSWYYVH
jgi:hypothetical protein